MKIVATAAIRVVTNANCFANKVLACGRVAIKAAPTSGIAIISVT
jgi:exopolyphosphatase/pppGpp-phosphohydrolase